MRRGAAVLRAPGRPSGLDAHRRTSQEDNLPSGKKPRQEWVKLKSDWTLPLAPDVPMDDGGKSEMGH